MKFLSVRQPYAWAIVRGYKPVENRNWQTNNPAMRFRGPVLIQAGLQEMREHIDGVVESVAIQTKRKVTDVRTEYHENRHFGAIVGATTVTDIVSEMDNDWFFGPYGLVLKNSAWCYPVPCRGMQGFINCPEDVMEQLSIPGYVDNGVAI